MNNSKSERWYRCEKCMHVYRADELKEDRTCPHCHSQALREVSKKEAEKKPLID